MVDIHVHQREEGSDLDYLLPDTYFTLPAPTPEGRISVAASDGPIYTPLGCLAPQSVSEFIVQGGVWVLSSNSDIEQVSFFEERLNLGVGARCVESNEIYLSGIGAAQAFTLTNAEVSINGGEWVSAGTLDDGDFVRLRLDASPTPSTRRDGSITVAGITRTFRTYTQSDGAFVNGEYSVTWDTLIDFDTVGETSRVTGPAGPGVEGVVATDGPSGSSALRYAHGGAAPAGLRHEKVVNVPLETPNIGVWMRYPDLARSDELAMFFYRDPFGSELYQNGGVSPNTAAGQLVVRNGEWAWVDVSLTQFNAAGGETPWVPGTTRQLERVRFDAEGPADGTDTLTDLYRLTADMKQNIPVVIFSFDDANDTDFLVAHEKYAKPNGVSFTSYIIGDKIDTAGFLTSDQIKTMFREGVHIANHGDIALDTLTQAQAQADIEANRDALTALGIPRRHTAHYSFPLGNYNADSVDAARAAGVRSARSVRPRSYVWHPSMDCLNTHAVAASDANGNPASVISRIDEAVSYGRTLEIYAHRLQAAGTAGHTIESDWATVFDYALDLHSRGIIKIMSKLEAYEAFSPVVPD